MQRTQLAKESQRQMALNARLVDELEAARRAITDNVDKESVER